MQPIDYLLSAQQMRRIRAEAERALKKADAIGCFPTPVKAIMEAADVEEVEDQILDHGFLYKMRRQAGSALYRAVSKVIGLFDAVGKLVFVDRTIHVFKQVFVRLHELGHSVLPWQREMYALVETSEQSIAPDVAKTFDREANVFAAEVLFQVGGFSKDAAEMDFTLQTAVDLSDKYGASIHASIWEFAARNVRPCVVVVTTCPILSTGDGFRARFCQAIPSATFVAQFGHIAWPRIYTPDDQIGALLPVQACRSSDKRTIAIKDSNGDRIECVAESFSNSYNVFVLIYPVRALTSKLVHGAAMRSLHTLGSSSLSASALKN